MKILKGVLLTLQKDKLSGSTITGLNNVYILATFTKVRVIDELMTSSIPKPEAKAGLLASHEPKRG